MVTNYQVKEYVEANPGWVYRKITSIPGAYLLKYKNRVFYDSLWDEILTECRGTLVDQDYNIIARPFTKIFNQFEDSAPTISPDENCIAFRKINGFMAALSVFRGELIVSTTGSTDSEFAVLARKVIEETCNVKRIIQILSSVKSTAIVEIVHESDPHIIEETPGVYLLGMRGNYWENSYNVVVDWSFAEYKHWTEQFGMFYCDRIEANFSTICDWARNAKHEGYVIYNAETGESLKIKSPYYLMAKFLARKNQDKLIALIDNPHEIKKIVDEEFYPIVDAICSEKEYYVSLTEQERLTFIRNLIGSTL